MSTMSKKEIQELTSDNNFKISSVDKDDKSQDSNYTDFKQNIRIWNKFNFEIVSLIFMRLLLVTVTAITFMQLERTL